MKFNNDVKFSYKGYLQQIWCSNETDPNEEIAPILGQFQTLGNADRHIISPTFLIIDYSKRNYLLCTDGLKHVLGYHPREILENGIDFTINIIKKDCFKIFNENIFPATVDFLKKTPQADHSKYVFTFNTMMKNASGKYISILQKSIYITSKETNMPLYCLAMAFDISDYKMDNSIVQQIQRMDKSGNSIPVDTNYYYLNEEDAFLTKHEKGILKWMAEGLSSKMIAGKMRISENTISNHRQNMLRKTNTKNVANLVAFAVRKNII